MFIGETIRAIIFDLDGTLYHLEVDWPNLSYSLQQEGFVDQDLDSQLRAVSAAGREDLVELAKRFELEGVQRGQPVAGAQELLTNLDPNLRLGLFTRNFRRTASDALARLGVRRPIAVRAREDVNRSKPHPEGLSTLLTELAVEPQFALAVGDSYHDVQASKAAGIKVAVVHNPRLKFSPEGADFYISSLLELPTLLEEN